MYELLSKEYSTGLSNRDWRRAKMLKEQAS